MRNRTRSTLLGLAWLALALPLATVQAGEVWKCQLGTQIRYSDQPCPSQGETLAPRALQPNVVAAPLGPRAGRNVGNVCPDDIEISAMEMRSKSSALGAVERDFFLDEIRHARRCRQGQGRYTAADWELSRQAQAAQAQPDAGAEARRRVAAQHSAAEAAEAARMTQLRRAQEPAQTPSPRPGSTPMAASRPAS